jgi:ADP-heptose:LPS heptosyltransferase
MKEICINIAGCNSLGDTLCATPIVRKISKSYNRKVHVISKHPDLFKNSPYVDRNIPYTDEEFDRVNKEYEVMSTFDVSYKDNGVCNKHNVMDIRQLHAINLGFMLTKDEMTLDYIPNEDVTLPHLPNKYVLIHPVQNWNSRTWPAKNWQMLTQLLNEKGISVISIGKNSSELGGSNVDKPVFDFPIKLGYNLMNQTSLDQTWHLINNSMCFVTMDSGLLHLAGTTDAEIIQLGSSINPEFRTPYRNGSQEYKYHYVRGGCGLNCASDMKYGVQEWGSIQGIPSLVNCLERKETFECHPSVLHVYNKIIEIIDKNKNYHNIF